MKLNIIFAHDHTFIVDNGSAYSYGSYPENYWRRYLDHTESVSVVARFKHAAGKEVKGYVYSFPISSDPSIHFKGVANIPVSWRIGLPRGRQWCDVKKTIDGTDAAVCRLPSDIGWAVALQCIRDKKPYAVEVVGDAFAAYFYRGGLLGKIYAYYSELRLRYLVRKASACLYVTPMLAARYPPNKNAPTVFATNAVINEISSEDWVGERYKRLQQEGYVPKVGLIGSYFVNYKGIDLAIKALSHFVKAGKPFRLHVLGDGNPDPYLTLATKLGVANYFSFDGLIAPGEPVRQWLRGCDYYIQPSRQEGLPRGLLEAISTRLPAVGSTAGGIAGVLEPRFVHDVDDFEGLLDVMRTMFEENYLKLSAEYSNIAREYLNEVVDSRRKSFYQRFFEDVEIRRCKL